MQLSAFDIHEYYTSPLGRFTQAAIANALEHSTLNIGSETSSNLERVGLGYCGEFLDKDSSDFLFLPPDLGLYTWPQNTEKTGTAELSEKIYKNRSCASRLNALPIPDNSIDIVLMVHGLEFADDDQAVIGEAWRILKAEGRLIVVVPNRSGLWSSRDHTPFGFGKPYSLSQLRDILRNENFVIEKNLTALHTPPFKTRLMRKGFQWMEHLATTLPIMPGVLITEARKRIMTPLVTKRRKSMFFDGELRWIEPTAPQTSGFVQK